MRLYRDRNSPFWQYDFSYQGVRFRGSTQRKDKRQAKIVADAKWQQAVESRARGDDGKRPPMALNVAFSRFYQEVTQHTANAATEDSQLARLLKRLGKETLLSDITDSTLAEYVARRRGDRVRKQRKATKEDPTPPVPPLVSNRTVNADTELLRRVFRRAHKTWKRDIGEPPEWAAHMLPVADQRIRYLTGEEEKALLAKLRPDYHALVSFCILSGARLGAAIRLTWKQADPDGDYITVKSKSRKPGGKAQTIPVTSAIRVILRAEKGKHPIYVFTYECRRSRGQRKKGERYPFSISGWRKDWKAALGAAGIEDFRFHDLRHTFATRFLSATGNLRLLKDAMAHEDLQSTLRYTHVLKDDIRTGMEQMTAENRQNLRAVDAKMAETNDD